MDTFQTPSALKIKLKKDTDLNTQSSQNALRRIITILTKEHSTQYVGVLATKIGHSIETTEVFIEHLMNEGVIRYLTEDEKRMLFYRNDDFIVKMV